MIQKTLCAPGGFDARQGEPGAALRQPSVLRGRSHHHWRHDRTEKVALDGQDVMLVLWDLYGDDEFQQIGESYLEGSSRLHCHRGSYPWILPLLHGTWLGYTSARYGRMSLC